MALNLSSQASSEGADSYAALPVWRRVAFQVLLLAAILGAIVVASQIFQPRLAAGVGRALSLALAPLPLLLWLLVSVWPEYRASRPRRRLIGVAVLSGLTAAALGLPLIEDFFRIELWLPLAAVFQRIIGYTLTAGMLDVGLKFLVLRHLIYPEALRHRSDAIAYAFASAVGYSFYLNLAYVWRVDPAPDFAAIVVLTNVAVQLASSLFIALGIVESYFSDAMPLVLPINLFVAASTTGLIAPTVSGLMSGPLGVAGSSDRPLFALLMLLATLLVTLGIVYFLYSNSERREREAYRSRGVNDGI